MSADTLIQTLVVGAVGLVLLGVAYLGALGARALFREARRTAREAGHQPRSAAIRATVRMVFWSLYFAAFYFAVYLFGKRLGWWVIVPALVAVALLIAGLLRADELLTVRPGDVRRQIGIGATLAALEAFFGCAIWLGLQLS